MLITTPGKFTIGNTRYRGIVGGQFVSPALEVEGGDKNTLLLLHGDSIIDSSANAVPVANNGVSYGAAQSKFGNGSFQFQNGDYLTVSLANLGLNINGDYTFDWWEYATSAPDWKNAIVCIPKGRYGYLIGSLSSKNIRMFAGNTDWNIVPITNIGVCVLNTWIHRAVCKQSNTIYCFENGSLVTTITQTGDLSPTDTLYIGYRATSSNNGSFIGYLEEIRISNKARWTTDFSVPTKPYDF